MSEDGASLLVRAVAGDPECLSRLLEAHGPTVRSRTHVRQPWASLLDAEDVMQVTYLEAFLRISDFRGETPDAFAGWLERIAQNNLRDAIRELDRGKRPSPRHRVAARSDESYRGLLETMAVDSATPSRLAADEECRNIIEEALERLPESYRLVIRLYDLEGLPIANVSRELGRSAGAVHMLRARALDRLRELLGRSSQY